MQTPTTAGVEGTGGAGGQGRLRDAGLAAAPVGGGRAWPDNEPTRRAKLAARTARGRADAHGRVKQPCPQPQLSRSSADTPRRAVAAIGDGDAGGGQPVA